MSMLLTEIDVITLPQHLARRTQDHLRAAGSRGCEGMALWAGQFDGSGFGVTEVIIPKQDGLITDHGLAVTVSGEELHRINVYLYRKRLRLVAQIHSHPGHAFHSDTDDRYAVVTACGSFSLVVPNFAAGPFEVAKLATYRLLKGWWWWDRSPRWRKVPSDRAVQIIVIGD